MASPLKLTRTHRVLITLVVTGALIIAGIGFAGSYAAVRALAERKGFGQFSLVFPIGIDAGICVLLSLDLLLTWIRIPFPLLRQAAWLLTAATIAFNGAAAWPDPLGTGMHAVIPLLFVVAVEAARHAVGRIADITADRHMEGVRLTRWLLSPLPTFLLWRRMKLWELRSYEQVIKLEQERLVYQARLRSRFGRAWRRKAPVESLMPLRLARYGVPLAQTAGAGLAAAGIEAGALPAGSSRELERGPEEGAARPAPQQPTEHRRRDTDRDPAQAHPVPEEWAEPVERREPVPEQSPWFAAPRVQEPAYEGTYDPGYVSQDDPQPDYGDWYARRAAAAAQRARAAEEAFQDPGAPQGVGAPQGHGAAQDEADTPYPQEQGSYAREQLAHPVDPDPPLDDDGGFRVPAGPGRTRRLGGAEPSDEAPVAVAAPPERQPEQLDAIPEQSGPEELPAPDGPALPGDMSRDEAYFQAFRKYVNEYMDFPNARQFGLYLQDLYGVAGQSGGPLTEGTLRPYLRDFRTRFQRDLDAEEHIA